MRRLSTRLKSQGFLVNLLAERAHNRAYKKQLERIKERKENIKNFCVRHRGIPAKSGLPGYYIDLTAKGEPYGAAYQVAD